MKKNFAEAIMEMVKDSEKRSSRLIGLKKDNFIYDNFLLFPAEFYDGFLKSKFKLSNKTMSSINNVTESVINSIQPQIQNIAMQIENEDNCEVIQTMMETFFRNKFKADLLSTNVLVNDNSVDDTISWIINWKMKEFVLPSFLCAIFKDERQKAYPYIMNYQKNNFVKSQNESSELSILIAKISEAKKNLLKTGKRVTISAVARSIEYKDSTLRDKIKKIKAEYNLSFEQI